MSFLRIEAAVDKLLIILLDITYMMKTIFWPNFPTEANRLLRT